MGFSATDPVSRGRALSWYGETLAITEVISPATNFVLDASSQNPTPPAGSQYILIRVSIVCDSGQEYRDYCGLATSLSFQLIGTDGATYPQAENLGNILNSFDSTAFLEGNTAEGYLAFIIPTTSHDLVLVITKDMFGEIYFALE